METAQKSIDFTNTYYFIKFLTKKLQFQRNQNYFLKVNFGDREEPSGFMKVPSIFMKKSIIYLSNAI